MLVVILIPVGVGFCGYYSLHDDKQTHSFGIKGNCTILNRTLQNEGYAYLYQVNNYTNTSSFPCQMGTIFDEDLDANYGQYKPGIYNSCVN